MRQIILPLAERSTKLLHRVSQMQEARDDNKPVLGLQGSWMYSSQKSKVGIHDKSWESPLSPKIQVA